MSYNTHKAMHNKIANLKLANKYKHILVYGVNIMDKNKLEHFSLLGILLIIINLNYKIIQF